MALLVGYRGRYTPLDIPASDLDEWVTTLQNMSLRIYQSLLTRITDENTFRKIIAEPAYDAWSDFINPNWEEADLIKLRYRIKLLGAYKKWLKGVVCAYHGSDPNLNIQCEEGSPYFSARVAEKKLKLGAGIIYTLGSTGLRYMYGRGIAVKAIGVISGMKRVKSDIRDTDLTKTITRYNPETGQQESIDITIPHDDFEGDVVNVFLPGAARFVRMQAIAIITLGLVNAHYANAYGLTSERNAVISLANQYLQNTVLKQVDTANYAVWLGIAFLDAENRLVVCSEAQNAGATTPAFCTELGGA